MSGFSLRELSSEPRRGVALGVVLVVTLTLAGCSGSDDSPGSDAQTTATEQTETTSAPTTSDGQEPRPSRVEPMPGMVGTPLDEALELLRSLDLDIEPRILNENTTAFPPDTVISHMPEKGEDLVRGQEVTLIVAIPD